MKYVYLLIGFIFLGLGIVGIALPILPTVPFLLVSSFFFTKASDRAREWFHSTEIYKKHLKEFEENRSMPLKTKVCLLAFASTMLMIAFFKMSSIYGRAAIIAMMIFKYYYFIFRIKTCSPAKKTEIERNFERN